jgi:hypothetical protein
MQWTLVRTGLAALAVGAALSAALADGQGPMTGAIWTTDSTGTRVNQNLYASREAVYLNGGPQNANGGNALPEGSYYVQVTEPDGTVLGTSVGSSDETPFVVGADGDADDGYQLWAILIKASDGTQGYDATTNPGGEYKVWVSNNSSFTQSGTKTDNFKVREEDTPTAATVNVRKFYDANANGTFDSGESYVEGWQVDISGEGGYTDTVFTSWTSEFEPGDYTFTEATPVQSYWLATTGLSRDVTLEEGTTTDILFGNLCLGAGGGHTLGFWSNKNGQKLIDSADLAALAGLSLVDGSGNAFNPTTAGAVKTWLLDGTAVNMANMLSVQLAAMTLNVREGNVDGDALLHAPGCGNTGVDLDDSGAGDFITVSDLLAAAEAALAADGYTPSGDANRAYQDCLKDALDDGNNNLNFVQSSPLAFTF